MRTPRVISYFGALTDPALEAKSQFIISSVAEHSDYFKTPTPEIAVLLEAVSAFSDAMTAAATGDRMKIAAKNRCRKTLEALLRELAAYVTLVAKGDREILICSGFDLQKENAVSPVMVPPTGLDVRNGNNSGEVIVKLIGAKNVNHYRHEYTAGPVTENSVWTVFTHNKRQRSFEGLKPRVEHFFRSAGVDTDGNLAYSKTVSWMVQ